MWEEIHVPIAFAADRAMAEKIMLEATAKETMPIVELAQPAIEELQKRFLIEAADLTPRVFVRVTNNWVELSVRFLCKDHDIRGLKDRMSRNILDGLDRAGIAVATTRYDLVKIQQVRTDRDALHRS